MTRHNYRQTTFERIIGRPPVVALHPQLRAPGIALGAALLVTLFIALVDLHRITVLDGELTALRDRIRSIQRTNASVDALGRSVSQLEAVRRSVIAARYDGIVSANALTHIGNVLPPQTWLTHVDANAAGTWTIAGRSTRVDEIGATLAAIATIDHRATVRLVSINAGGKSGKLLDFVIAWDGPR